MENYLHDGNQQIWKIREEAISKEGEAKQEGKRNCTDQERTLGSSPEHTEMPEIKRRGTWLSYGKTQGRGYLV